MYHCSLCGDEMYWGTFKVGKGLIVENGKNRQIDILICFQCQNKGEQIEKTDIKKFKSEKENTE